jgi:dTDP-4-dehydrorhamnose 3,5-epimerase
VDLRNGSRTYGQYVAVELSGDNKRQLFVPRGFAHGFLVLSENAIFSYKVDNVYAPDYDSGISWNDPILNITWGIDENEILVSKKDSKLPFFSDFKSPF